VISLIKSDLKIRDKVLRVRDLIFQATKIVSPQIWGGVTDLQSAGPVN
jgi:hypothetical protein